MLNSLGRGTPLRPPPQRLQGRITPAKLAGLSVVLRLPILRVETLLQRCPLAVRQMEPAHWAGRLQQLCAALGIRPGQALFLVTKQPAYYLLTPLPDIAAKLPELGAALGVPPGAVLRVALAAPSLLRRSAPALRRRVKTYCSMLRCSPLDVLHVMARGPEYLSDTPSSVRQRMLALGLVRPDIVSMSARVMNSKVNGLMSILNKRKRLVVTMVVGTPALLRCDLDRARSVFRGLQAMLSKREGFVFAMLCHAPHLLLMPLRSMQQRCTALRRCLGGSGEWQQQFAQLKPPLVARLLLNQRGSLSAMMFLLESGRAGGAGLERLLDPGPKGGAARALGKSWPGFVSWMDGRRERLGVRMQQRRQALMAAAAAAAATTLGAAGVAELQRVVEERGLGVLQPAPQHLTLFPRQELRLQHPDGQQQPHPHPQPGTQQSQQSQQPQQPQQSQQQPQQQAQQVQVPQQSQQRPQQHQPQHQLLLHPLRPHPRVLPVAEGPRNQKRMQQAGVPDDASSSAGTPSSSAGPSSSSAGASSSSAGPSRSSAGPSCSSAVPEQSVAQLSAALPAGAHRSQQPGASTSGRRASWLQLEALYRPAQQPQQQQRQWQQRQQQRQHNRQQQLLRRQRQHDRRQQLRRRQQQQQQEAPSGVSLPGPGVLAGGGAVEPQRQASSSNLPLELPIPARPLSHRAAASELQLGSRVGQADAGPAAAGGFSGGSLHDAGPSSQAYPLWLHLEPSANGSKPGASGSNGADQHVNGGGGGGNGGSAGSSHAGLGKGEGEHARLRGGAEAHAGASAGGPARRLGLLGSSGKGREEQDSNSVVIVGGRSVGGSIRSSAGLGRGAQQRRRDEEVQGKRPGQRQGQSMGQEHEREPVVGVASPR
ncbi:hypothetical protein TSOC_007374 [Tetrabaena socialis]|uniref:Uncharacterized protein n=1 Tax=Tetrabaena socialis TaxID=47790 RepID=A0A2J8A172_9CHLO|nr:hypothetical protein TSOC_007374 [Tetrabaena socialis]|eukprot:PNH06271.1 hypothetical protein TSOC_007374 [Tetrabaena socialis]